MKRPFASKRPIGPFVESRTTLKTVLITLDFTDTQQKEQLGDLVESVGNTHFNGFVADTRREDHAVDGDEGIRVVYDTQVNAVFKDNIDEFQSDIELELSESNIPSKLGKTTVVAAER